MLYNVGDKLKCKHEVNTQCLEMTNPMFNIYVGDIYIVTDKDDYPEILWEDIIMSKLVQNVNFNLSAFPKTMYCYGEASFEANKEMQEPLEKLYKYENQPDMREKIREYINELDTEIDRLESDLEKQMTYNVEACKVTATESRLNAIVEVKNDLLGRLEEVI